MWCTSTSTTRQVGAGVLGGGAFQPVTAPGSHPAEPVPWVGADLWVPARAVSLAGLGQVLDFMYTAKLSLNPDNVEDVLAVAGFLQMQEIVSACNALKSLTVLAESPVESQEVPAETGT